MGFKKNYFLDNIKGWGINTLSEYLTNSPHNYVILENNVPILWASNIFGGIKDVEKELNALEGYKNKDIKY